MEHLIRKQMQLCERMSTENDLGQIERYLAVIERVQDLINKLNWIN